MLNSIWIGFVYGLTLYWAIASEGPARILFVGLMALHLAILYHFSKNPRHTVSMQSIDLLWQGIEMVDQKARRAEQKARQLSSSRLRYLFDNEFWAKYLLKYAQDNATNWPKDWETITLLEEHLKSIQRDITHAQKDHSTFLDLYR